MIPVGITYRADNSKSVTSLIFIQIHQNRHHVTHYPLPGIHRGQGHVDGGEEEHVELAFLLDATLETDMRGMAVQTIAVQHLNTITMYRHMQQSCLENIGATQKDTACVKQKLTTFQNSTRSSCAWNRPCPPLSHGKLKWNCWILTR